MALTNNLKKQVDLPVWEWMRFNPAGNTSGLTCLTTARDGLDRYMYYFASNVLYRYDTWGDTWQQLSTNVTPVGALNAKYVKNQGFRGQVLSATSNTIQIPSTGGNNLHGFRVRIISGTGAGQERTITSTNREVTHDSGLVTAVSQNVLTDGLKKWKFNQWEGYSVIVNFGTGFSQFREVTYNDTGSLTVFDANYEGRNFLMAPFSTTAPYGTLVTTAGAQAQYAITSQVVTVDSPWETTPDASSKFMVLSGGIWWISQIAATPFFSYYYYDILSDRFIQKLTPGGIFSAALATDWALAPLAENLFTASISSSNAVTSTTSISLTDTNLNLTTGSFVGYNIKIVSGSGEGQSKRIVANTNNTFRFATEWDTLPNTSSYYRVSMDEANFLAGNARAQLLKYEPEPSLWGTGHILNNGTALQLALLKTNSPQHHGVTTATKVSGSITAINPVPTASGSGYVQGDVLNITTGGTLGRVYVEAINYTGSIISMSLLTLGSGYTPGTGRATSGGAGTGCTVEIVSTGSAAVFTTAINHDFNLGDTVTFAGDSGSLGGLSASFWNANYTINGIQSQTVVEAIITGSLTGSYLPASPKYTLATNLLVDVCRNFPVNKLAGKLLGIQSNGLTGTVTWRRIIGNSATTISFIGGVAPTNGNSRYFVQDLEAFGRDVNYLADNQLSYGYASATSTTGSLIDTTKNWIPGAYNNHKIRLIDVNSTNEVEDIVVSNTSSSLVLGRTIALGAGTNTLAYSDDNGVTWLGNGATIFTTAGNKAVWSGTRFVGVGQGTNTIAYSNDGITWTGLGAAVFSVSGSDVVWNGTRFVAVGAGTNTIAYSNDGVTWVGLGTSIFSTAGNGITWNGSKFVAVGQGTNTIAQSSDGIIWSGSGATVFTAFGEGVTWANDKFVAVGSGTNTIATSSDGVTWSGQGSSVFTTQGNYLAWNGSILVGVGSGTNHIAYSLNSGSTWTGLGTSIFSTSGNGVSWNGLRFVAAGQGTNTLAYSPDGIAWTGSGATIFTTLGGGTSNTSPFASTVLNIGFAPNTASYYQINDTYGSATAGSTTTLQDNNKKWKVNQWAGKRLIVTSGTGVQQEITITSNTANTLTFGTSTAPDISSTYTILGKPVVGAGISIEWNWGSSDLSTRGKQLIIPRGGASHTIDIYDLNTNRFKYGQFILGQGETLTTGTMYAYDGQDRLYFQKDATGRIFYYDLVKNRIDAFGFIPYGMSTAVLSNRMEIVQTADGLKYLYIMRHTGTEMWRTIVIF
jgi:hypothetical protein